MADTGLSDIMSPVFGGVSKMLIGKKFPQNVRALRIVAEEALCGLIQDKPLHCSGDLMQILETEASKSQTTKRWVDVLIKPILVTMMFVRAECEGDCLNANATILLCCGVCELCEIWVVLCCHTS